jgi:two-component system, sensor histidine kinase and response regulator
MRILVAEDDVANRELLVELLRSRGHFVAGVCDGREALAALEKENFEIVFMDQEMPVMGGIDAARAIHRMNFPGGQRPIIVGMSGNVAEADERHCLEAGMDTFLGKPISISEITGMLEFFKQPRQKAMAEQTASLPAILPSDDLAASLQRATGGDQKILRSLVKNFLADAPGKLTALRRALAEKDPAALASTAHSFKGLLGIFGAHKAAANAHNLQELGRRGDLNGAANAIAVLEDEFKRLREELLALDITAKAPRKRSEPRRKRQR